MNSKMCQENDKCFLKKWYEKMDIISRCAQLDRRPPIYPKGSSGHESYTKLPWPCQTTKRLKNPCMFLLLLYHYISQVPSWRLIRNVSLVWYLEDEELDDKFHVGVVLEMLCYPFILLYFNRMVTKYSATPLVRCLKGGWTIWIFLMAPFLEGSKKVSLLSASWAKNRDLFYHFSPSWLGAAENKKCKWEVCD